MTCCGFFVLEQEAGFLKWIPLLLTFLFRDSFVLQ